MFKFGVYSAQQLKNGKTRTFFGAVKKISVTLLDDIRNNEAFYYAYPSLMYNLSDDRGAFKRTYENRFMEFDDRCILLLTKAFPASEIRVHDVAISSGETAVDFFCQLKERFSTLSYFATDYDPYLSIIRENSLTIAVTNKGSIVQLTLPPFVLTPKKPDRNYYPVNRLICNLLLKTGAKRLFQKYTDDKLPSDCIKEIDLFCPRARELARKDSRFSLGKFDILNSTKRRFDCIRAMNVLNESYFNDREFQLILENFHNSLEAKGLLILGSNSNPGSPLSGAIFSKTKDAFELIWSTKTKPTATRHVDIFNQHGE